MIDLIPLYSENKSKISIDGDYEIPANMQDNEEIHELSTIKVKGNIKKVEEDYYLTFIAKGEMKISDSVTLDDVWYPFEIDFDEKLDDFIEKDKNSLDIIEVLWQNIVLEVPLRYSIVSDYSKYQGDGWKLVSEEEVVNNNPFNTLLKDEDRSD
jgi:uncharacterized protein